jgi:hypothetical protein
LNNFKIITIIIILISTNVIAQENLSQIYRNLQNDSIVVSRDGKLGLNDRSGNIILPLKYDYIQITRCGIIVSSNKKYGMLDYSGKVIIPLKYDGITYINTYTCCVSTHIRNKSTCYEKDVTSNELITIDEMDKRREQKIREREKKEKYGFAFGPTFSFFPNFAWGGEFSIYLNTSYDQYLQPMGWFVGIYSDFLHDIITQKTRITLGPEIGSYNSPGFLTFSYGIDGGLVLSKGDGKTNLGFAIRPFAIIVLPVFVYYRFIWLNESSDKNIIHEMGVSIKFPILDKY